LKNIIIKDDLAAFKEQIASILLNQNSRDVTDQDDALSSHQDDALSSHQDVTLSPDDFATFASYIFDDDDENNVWTLAAVQGSTNILEFLSDKMFDMKHEDLDKVLHFKNKVREISILRVIKQSRIEEINPITGEFEFISSFYKIL
jgi:hypothetical protein